MLRRFVTGIFDWIRCFLWHYLLCFLILIVYFFVFHRRNLVACAVCTCLMAVVSVVGFFVVYSGFFAANGKSFLEYAIGYGPVKLPIFFFPILGFIMTSTYRKRKST